jgi:hypothetical protein
MTRIVALPVQGEVFVDTRDAGRWMRLSWHHEDELVVFSIWRDHTCVASFRLSKDDVPKLIESLVNGLAEGYQGGHTSGHPRLEAVEGTTLRSRRIFPGSRIVSGHPAGRIVRRVRAQVAHRLREFTRTMT